MNEITINKEPVELFKLLKFEGIAHSGGAAKKMIEDKMVLLNGELETRKRKKVHAGDVIKVADAEFTIKLE